ncbi:MAG: MBL fold metallo-hydrolase [Acidobacteria bacterium]|nr:MBL fold metallo-hydrolase [Acidobacteriota bacterium]
MRQPVNHGRVLLEEIELAHCPVPSLWWLGHAGFVLKYKAAILYVDPCLSDAAGERLTAAPFAGSDVTHARLVLCTHAHPDHLDPQAVPEILEASRGAKLVIPKSVAEHAHSLGISYHRMVTTDSNLRVEYLDDRIYSVPSAHDQLDWTPLGGYPYLGYLVRFGGATIYHAGDCVPYDSLVDRLRPYTVTVALLPVSGRAGDCGNFEIAEAAQLAEDIGARWLVPMHYGTLARATVDIDRFIEHMLFHRPEQRFKVFECGEGWEIPED